MQAVRRIYDWAAQKAYSPRSPLWLGFIFILEMFLFLPMDALLMLFCMHNPKQRYMYALVATLSPGNYTAQVSGANGTTGIALVEIYAVR